MGERQHLEFALVQCSSTGKEVFPSENPASTELVTQQVASSGMQL